MKRLGRLTVGLALTVTALGVQAQEKDTKGVNPLSVREISDADVMLKHTLWRRIDLKEKQNQPLFSKGNEMTRYIIDAVKAGLLDAYEQDNLDKKLTLDKFSQKLQIPATKATVTQEEINAGFTDAPAQDDWSKGDKKKEDAAKPAVDDWGNPIAKKTDQKSTAPVDEWGNATKKTTKGKKGKNGKQVAAAPKPAVDSTEIKKKMAEEAMAAAAAAAAKMSENEFFPDQLSVLEVKEDWIFDRKRSRQYYDIQTITVFVPADMRPDGVEMPVATFKYKDLDKLFRSDPKKFIWFNEYNTAQHKNLADAFDLRLPYGRIIKSSNPKDLDLITIYGAEKEALWKSIQMENELMELEHGLWEY
ncbi:MAG: gliding motility protein GldN [Runella slithyformis]|nr:MAG: gliding motility protein GldN [Runella slithyformis]